MNNSENIIALLQRNPGLADDEISSHINFKPRQVVNQICRLLESRGLLKRITGPKGKIVNHLTELKSEAGRAISPTTSPLPSKGNSDSSARVAAKGKRSVSLSEVCALKLSETLVLIPCSGSKSSELTRLKSGPSISDYIKPSLVERLAQARLNLAERIHLFEKGRLPAWRRYTGGRYQAGFKDDKQTISVLANIGIISGGYGLVLASEGIGTYEAVFKPRDWPEALLDEVLTTYIDNRQFKSVIAFISATTAYRRFLENCRWSRSTELQRVYVVSPESSSGAMLKAPNAAGEALSDFLHGELQPNFLSSYRLSIGADKIYEKEHRS